jgi:hypothetical protein
LLGDFKLHRALGLLLHDDRSRADAITMRNVSDAQPDQIASTQLAVDGQVEQCEIACARATEGERGSPRPP